MDTMLQNFLNGNLTDAKRQARRFSQLRIYNSLVKCHGYSLNKAALTAMFLKGRDCWQAACDAD